MCYIVTKNSNNMYKVREQDPDYKHDVVIAEFESYDDAILVCNHFRRGGGFDGWTPGFVLKNNGKVFREDLSISP